MARTSSPAASAMATEASALPPSTASTSAGGGSSAASERNNLTALEMPGMSLTILPVNEARLRWLDAPTAAPAWPGDGRIGHARQIVRGPAAVPEPLSPGLSSPNGEMVRRGALAAAAALERAEAQLTELDGDGDLI